MGALMSGATSWPAQLRLPLFELVEDALVLGGFLHPFR